MLSVTIVEDGKEIEIGVNQKHICSFRPIGPPEKLRTEIRMSNGDIFEIIKPPYNQWQVDVYITDTNY